MRKLLQHFVLAILANALALYVVQYFLADQGFEITRGVLGFALVGFMLGLLNTLVRPILKLVSLPVVFLTMGLFLIVVNAIILFLTEYFFNTLFAETFDVTFHVGDGIVTYLIAAVLLSIVNTVTHWLLAK